MKIFISFASEDYATAELYQSNLTADGHKVFASNIEPGDGYHEKIRKSIKKCGLFVFLISPSSVAKECFTQNELAWAEERWPNPVGHVLPIRIQKTPIDHIPVYLRPLAIYSPTGDPGAWVVEVVNRYRWSAQLSTLVRIMVPLIFLVFGVIAGSYPKYWACEYGLPGCMQKPLEEPLQIAEVEILCIKASENKEPDRTPTSAYVLIHGGSGYIKHASAIIESIKTKFKDMELLDKNEQKKKYLKTISDEGRGGATILYRIPAESTIRLPIPTQKGEDQTILIFMAYRNAMKSGTGELEQNDTSAEKIEKIASASIEPKAPLSAVDDPYYPAGYSITRYNLTLYAGDLECWEPGSQ